MDIAKKFEALWIEIRKLHKLVQTVSTGGGSGITELTGDATAGPGSGSQALTLANSGVSADTYGDDTHVAQITVDAKGRITAASDVAISADITSGSDDFIQILRPGKYSQGPSHIGGSFTVGQAFKPFRNMNITGAEFVLPSGLNGKNVKVSLWDPSGPTQLKTVTVSGAVTGTNTATFSSAQAVTTGTEYRLGMWVNDGSGYSKAADMPQAGVVSALLYLGFGYFSAGDAMPATTTAAEQYPINPTIA